MEGRTSTEDVATLFLCRQGSHWIVVLDSPEVRGAARLGRVGHDSFDARFELLSRARRACPEASFAGTEGLSEGADYEWRLDVRGAAARRGQLGLALERALEGDRPRHRKRADVVRRTVCRRQGEGRRMRTRPIRF